MEERISLLENRAIELLSLKNKEKEIEESKQSLRGFPREIPQNQGKETKGWRSYL